MQIKSRLRPEKAVIGVVHEDWNLGETLAELAAMRFKRLGLEVPSDYKERKLTHKIAFFDSIAAAYCGTKVEIVPLDDAALNVAAMRHSSAIEIAVEILVSGITYGTFPKSVVQSVGNYIRSTDPAYFEKEARILTEGVDDVLRNGLASQWINTFHVINGQRTKKMLETVQRRRVDVVVVGDMHAKDLARHLPRYRYIQLLGSAARP